MDKQKNVISADARALRKRANRANPRALRTRRIEAISPKFSRFLRSRNYVATLFCRKLFCAQAMRPPHNRRVAAIVPAFVARHSAVLLAIRAKKIRRGLRRIFECKTALRTTNFPFRRRNRPQAVSCSSFGSSCRSSSGCTTTTRPTKPCSSQPR